MLTIAQALSTEEESHVVDLPTRLNGVPMERSVRRYFYRCVGTVWPNTQARLHLHADDSNPSCVSNKLLQYSPHRCGRATYHWRQSMIMHTPSLQGGQKCCASCSQCGGTAHQAQVGIHTSRIDPVCRVGTFLRRHGQGCEIVMIALLRSERYDSLSSENPNSEFAGNI
jgi:hypothetical protein